MQLELPITRWARALLFDFDYTLGDSSEAVVACVNYALGTQGLCEAPPAVIRQMIGMPLSKIFAQLGAVDVQEAIAQFQRQAEAIMVAQTILVPGLPERIRYIAQNTGLKLAVISTKNRRRIEEILDKFAISFAFQAVVGGDEVSEAKPSPEATRLALTRLNCAPQQALFIGDSVMDAGSAQAAGVMFVGIATRTTTPALLREKGAVRVYRNVVQALDELLQLPDPDPPRPEAVKPLTRAALAEEVEISYFKSGGPGGQKKNKTMNAVRIKHKPTGIIVVATENRSQHKNRELAWKRLIDKLHKRQQRKRPRIPTKPPAAAKEARLQQKRRISEKKAQRKPPPVGE